MGSPSGKDLVRRHFEEMWNARNLDACEELHAEEYVEHAVAPFGNDEPGLVNGPEHVRGVVEWLTAGPLNGVVPPTGRRFSTRQTHWFRVQDGRLAEHWATREDLPAMIQLGVIRPPGAPDGSPPAGPPS